MKIGIITGYYSENSGTLLQALSVGQTLRKLGHEVIYIDTKNKYSTHSIKLLIARIAKELLHFNFYNARIAIKKYCIFRREIKKFNVIKIENALKEGIEYFVIGSDTVWNIEDKYFGKASNIYFPTIDEIKTISYAASVGNSKAESFEKYGNVMKSIDNMKAISVRDNYSKSVVANLTNKDIQVVVDPTILVDKSFFKDFIKKIDDKNYILVYAFNDFPSNTVKLIQALAKEKNKKIISLGKKYSWCNKQVTISLQDFISYFYNADYIITNTFHGNVFSILFNKQFVSLDMTKKKIHELLREYNIENRRCDYDGDIYKILNESIDYEKVNMLIEQNKEKSLEYLKNNLK